MHSMIMASSAPLRARSTAGSSRSAEKPAPVPMRYVSEVMSRPASIAAEACGFGEEHLLDGLRRLLDRSDLGHELGRLKHLLRLQRVDVILVVDDGEDVVDGVLRVFRDLDIGL